MPSFEDLVQLVANGNNLSSFNFETGDVADVDNRRNNRVMEIRSSERFKVSPNLPVLQEEENGEVGSEDVNQEMDSPTLNSLLNKARNYSSPVSPRKFLNQYMEDGGDNYFETDPFQALSTPPLANRNLEETSSSHSRLFENTSFDGLENSQQYHQYHQGPPFFSNQAGAAAGVQPTLKYDYDRVSTPNGPPYFNRSFDFGDASSVSKNVANSFENSF